MNYHTNYEFLEMDLNDCNELIIDLCSRISELWDKGEIDEYFKVKDIVDSYFYSRKSLVTSASEFKNINDLQLSEEEKEEMLKKQVESKQRIYNALYSYVDAGY